MVAALALSACGGSDNPSGPAPPTSPPGSGVVNIRGGERLGWVQAAASFEAIQAHSFRLFIDGNQTTMSEVRCGNTATDVGYECSGRLPPMSAGRHSLELSSVWNGIESGRSSPLVVMMGSALQPSAASSTVPIASGADASGPTPIASGRDDIEWLSPAPDGTVVLFVEGRRIVRVIEGEQAIDAPAYAVEAPDDAIVGMAVDPAFAKTRAVYVAWTEVDRNGSRVLNVGRFRYVGTSLGERATIVTGVPMPDAAVAPLAVDGDGLVYVAVPAVNTADRAAAFNGFILRFTSEGSVPAANPMTSPVLAAGFARPASLAIDHASRRLWATGTHSTSEHAIVTLALDARAGSVWPLRPQTMLPEGAARPGIAVSSLSITPPGQTPVLSVVSAGVARNAPLAADGAVGAFETVRFGAPGAVTGIALGDEARSYVAVKTTDGASAIFLTRDLKRD